MVSKEQSEITGGGGRFCVGGCVEADDHDADGEGEGDWFEWYEGERYGVVVLESKGCT